MKKFFQNLTDSQKKWLTFAMASVLLIFMFFISFLSSNGAFGIPGDSGIVDEIAHIPAGYSYDKYLDYRLNPEHPPLAKALAGLPLALNKNIKGIKDDWSWDGINQWEAGWFMLYENGNNPATVLSWSRLPMMLLMIDLGIFLFLWAKKLFGRKVALCVLALYALYPDVIAHGRLVTTDIPAAFGFVVSTYYFNEAIEKPSTKKTIYAAIAFGIGQLLKFSCFLLYGIFLLMIFAKSILDREKGDHFWKLWLLKLWQYFKVYFWVCLLSLIVVWVVYLPFVWKTPVGIEHKLIESNLTQDPKNLFYRTLLHHFEGNPFTRALGHYFLGVLLVFVRVSGGNATFALGHLSDKSISWFFPFAWLIKTPISVIILFLTSIVSFFFLRKKTNKDWRTFLLLTIPWLVYWAFTLKGSLNIGIRHLMPTVPFVLLLIGYLLSKIFQSSKVYYRYFVYLLILFMAISTISYYPSYIGYFNEFVPRDQRYNYLVDSSLDWGQDLLRLQKYVNDNHIESIKLDYFGGAVPSYYIPQAVDWHSSYGPTTGWLAISATFYQSSKLYGEKEGKWSYGWLDNIKPTAEIGGSILVYNITPDVLAKNPPRSPYKIIQVDQPDTTNNSTQKVGL